MANRLCLCCVVQKVRLPDGLFFFAYRGAIPDSTAGFTCQIRPRLWEQGVAPDPRAIVFIPLARLSVSSMRLTCLVTKAHAVYEEVPTVWDQRKLNGDRMPPVSGSFIVGEALVLGLSSGPACMASCGPVLVPSLLAGRGGVPLSARYLSTFLGARFLGYLLFAAVA